MSLTTCIRRAGKNLNAEDKNAILEAARVNRKAGMSADDAAKAAVRARLEEVQALLAAEGGNEATLPVSAPTLKERAEAMAAKGQPVHQDPGEAPEVATKAVVAEAIKTAAQNTDRSRSEMRAEALRLVDQAIANAPTQREADAGNEAPKKVKIKVPGDGEFTLVNTVEKLKEFRRQVELNPGFKDKLPTFPIGKAVTSGSLGPDGLAREMLEDGEPVNAVEILEAAGKTMMFGNGNGASIPYTNAEAVEIEGIADLFVGRGFSTKKGETSWWSVVHKGSGFAIGGSAGTKSEAIAEAKKLLGQPEKREKMRTLIASGKSADGKPFMTQDELREQFMKEAEGKQQATFNANDASIARATELKKREAERDAFYKSIMGADAVRPGFSPIKQWAAADVAALLKEAEKQGKVDEALKFIDDVLPENQFLKDEAAKFRKAYERRTKPDDTGWQTGFQAPGGYRRIRRDVKNIDGTTYRAELDERAGAYVTGKVEQWTEGDGRPRTVQTYSNDMDARAKADRFLDSVVALRKPKPALADSPELQSEAEFGAIKQAQAIAEAEREVERVKTNYTSDWRYKSKAAALRGAEADLKNVKESRPEQFAGDHLAAINRAIAQGKMPSAENIKRYDIPASQLPNAAPAQPAAASAAPPAQQAEPSAPAPADRPDIAAIRRDTTLDKETSENGEVMTRRQWVERKVAEGLQPQVKQEDRIKPMSRMAYFRATNEEQRAHERKIKEAGKKDVYWLGDYEVTKTEHDYAVSLLASATAPADDPFAALFGTPAEQEASQRRLVAQQQAERQKQEADRADIERLRQAVAVEKKRAQAEYDDWSSRVYKANKTQVDLPGDGPSNQASMSIGAINESRRRNAMEALTQEMRALDKLDAAMKADGAKVMNDLRDTLTKATKIAADGTGLFKTADEQFQYMLLDDLKMRGPGGKGNVTSNGLSKAMLAAIKGDTAAAASAEPQSWHTPLPEQGEPSTDQDRTYPSNPKSDIDARKVVARLAREAMDAITRVQMTNISVSGMTLYPWVLPAQGNRNGVVRLLPEDQQPSGDWQRVGTEPINVGGQRERAIDQLIARLGSAPVLATEKAPTLKQRADSMRRKPEGEAPDRDSFTLERGTADNTLETVTFQRGEYITYRIGEGGRQAFGEIDGISHARREFSVDGLWHPFGFAYKAERPAAVPKKDTVPLSSVVDKVNAKFGAGLGPADAVSVFEAFKGTMRAVYDGTASLEDYKAAYRRVRDAEAVKAELGKLTKEELVRTFGIMAGTSEKKDSLIATAYKAMLRGFALGKEFGPRSYMMTRGGLENYEKQQAEALDAIVENHTADDLAAYAAEVKAEREQKAAQRAARIEALQDPKTLEDFRALMDARMREGKTFDEARMTLTPEQRALMDEVAAAVTRGRRKASTDDQRTQVRVAGQTVDGNIIATKHTKKGHDLYVVQLAERVSREDYETLNTGAKKIGGYYSSFRGGGAIPGFQFTTREQAQAFVTLAGGDATAAKDAAEARRDAYADDRSQTAAERLTEMAEAMDAAADESMGRERKANTERRARFAAAAEASARKAKAMAKTMRNVAEALTSGKAKFLDRIRTKTQVELLQTYVANAKGDELRAKLPTYHEQEKRKGQPPTQETADYADFPTFTAFRSDLASLGRQLQDVDGTKKIGDQLMKVADDVSDAFTAWVKEPGNYFRVAAFSAKGTGERATFSTKDAAERAIARSGYRGKAIPWSIKRGEWTIIFSPSEAVARGLWKGDGDKRITLDAEFAADMVEKMGRANRRGAKVSVPWQFERAYERRKQLSRMGIETPAEFRAALREFIGLREQAAEADRIKALERAMVGRRNDGLDFFPTPESVADEMVAAADIQPDMAVLEPSAGMGHIADRIRAAGAEPDVIEMGSDRRELLQEKGYHMAPVSDFLALKPREFFTFGDVFRAPDGTEGVMMGVGMMGSRRVVLKPLVNGVEVDYRRGQWYDRDELVGVRHRGSDSGYDRIVMNPPFSDGRDIEHVRHAYTLLKPGGRIVALMGESAFTNQTKRATEFREWLESVGGTEEKLAPGSFMDPSLPVNTGANARMVVIEKPERGESAVPLASRAFGLREFGFVSPRQLRDEVAKITADWDQDLADVEVVNRVEDLPADIQQAVRNVGSENTVRGLAMPDGRVFLVAENISSLDEGRFVLFHEVYGHVGMRAFLGDGYSLQMRMLRKANPALAKEADAWFGRYGEDEIQTRIANAKMTPGAARQAVLDLAVEEALADRAGDLEVKGWQRIVAALQRGLRRLGLGSVADMLEGMTQAETVDLLLQARRTVQSGQMTRGLNIGRMPAYQRVWHGTPYRGIEQFSTDKIGTGEGAQAYGWGLYFAGKKEIAEHYRKKLSAGGKFTRIDGKRWDFGSDLSRPLTESERLDNLAVGMLQQAQSASGLEALAKRRDADPAVVKRAREMLPRVSWAPSGQTYEVDIPEDSEYLLWDKPLKEQPGKASQAVQRMGGATTIQDVLAGKDIPALLKWVDTFDRNNSLDEMVDENPGMTADDVREAIIASYDQDEMQDYLGSAEFGPDRTGESIYRELSTKLGSDQAASNALLAAGVRGIKYLDGTSRNAGDGTFNYVIFDGADAKIQGALFSRRTSQDTESAAVRNDLSRIGTQIAAQGYEPADVPNIQATRKLAGLVRRLEAGEITEAYFMMAVKSLSLRMADVSATKAANRLMKDRERGPDIVRERLIRARRQGDVDPESVDFALWALDQNESLAANLGISVRAPKDGAATGDYNPAAEIIRIFKGGEKDDTAVHEIMHHAERMMPPEMQAAIRREWSAAFAEASAKATPEQRVALGKMMEAVLGDKKAYADVVKAITEGPLNYAEHYQLVNPSEFWAVNASRLLQQRFDARDSVWGRIRNYLSDMVQKLKGLLRLRSDAPTLKALEYLLDRSNFGPERGGRFESSAMLSDQRALMTTDGRLPNLSRRTSQDILNPGGGVQDFSRYGKTKQDRLRGIIDKGREFYLGALTRDQIADVYGGDVPQVRAYDQLVRSMENERSSLAQRADEVYQRWAKIDAATSDKLGRIMLDATTEQVHPDSADKPADPAKAQIHAKLRAQFKLLPPEVQAMYREVRDFHAGVLNDIKTALVGRIERQVAAGAERAALLSKVQKQFDQYLEGGPYFPLSRFGDYLVIATRPDGERVVAAYENSGEQQAAARELRADGFTTKLKTAKEYARSQDGNAGKFIGDVIQAVEKVDMVEATINGSRSDLKNQLLDDLNQLFIRSLPDLSYRKHFAHRKNTPGFSADVMRGFASSAFHAASYIARLNHADRMTMNLQSAYEAIDKADEGDFNTQSQVLNELGKRHEAMLNPNTHPLSAAATQLGFVMYLGLSPAAGLINMLQVPMVTIPYLGAKYGFGKASAAMGKAYADIMKAPANRQSGFNAAQSLALSAEERQAISTLQDEGVIDLTQAHDLAAATDRDVGDLAKNKTAFAVARAMRIVGWTFHVPEVMNRQTTALMAYRLERENGADHEAGLEAARETIKRTQFDYSSSNRARYMQGNIARVVLQFKQFSQNMTYFLGRAAYQALKGESPEVRKIARRQILSTFVVTGTMAGSLGLPGIGAVMGAVGMLVSAMDDEDEPWDWQTEYRNALADRFGKERGEVFAKGAPRMLMPWWDIAGRVSLNELWWRNNDREGQNPREAFATDMANILGPTAGTLLGWYTAADHMQRGAYDKAAEAVVPKFIRDPLKAYREADEGVTSYNGDPLMDVEAVEVFGRAMGFAPARVSEMYEGRNAVMNTKTALEEKRQRLLNKVVKARLDGDREAEAEARSEVAGFNSRNPDFKITNMTIARSLMTRRRNRENTEQGILLPDTKADLREVGRFANIE